MDSRPNSRNKAINLSFSNSSCVLSMDPAFRCAYASDVMCKQKNLSSFLFFSNHVYDKVFARGFGDLRKLKRGNRIRIRPPAMTKHFETVKVQMRKSTAVASYTHQLNKEGEIDVFRLAQGIFRNFFLPLIILCFNCLVLLIFC